MSTIPASQIVNVIPGVLSAGGKALILNGLMLTTSPRVPLSATGPTVASFPTPLAVSAFFGPASKEYAKAAVYFAGFDNSTQKPSALLFAQYPVAAVPAYVQSAPINGYTIPQIQALSGSLTVTMDGATRTAGSLNLSVATSYSAAAALIQSALNTSEPAEATVTGSIAPISVSALGSIVGNLLTISTVSGGNPVEPGSIVSGTGVIAGTQVTSQVSGMLGGAGVYEVSATQIVASEALTLSYGLMTVSSVASGAVSIGQTYSGTGVTAGTLVTALGTGSGLAGTYVVSPSQTVSSETLQASATGIVVTYDSVSGALILTSGVTGPASTAAFATGSLASLLYLTSATGAVVSQGAAAAQPGSFMNNLTGVNQNWATFKTLFDPDDGQGNSQKLAFAQWADSTEDRYLYVCVDRDRTPAVSNSAPSSLGAIIASANLSGTFLIWEDIDRNHAAFVTGIGASIDFEAINGRTTYAFREQTGLVASVTDPTTAANLIANGYNFYGAYATANQQFVFLYPGSVSGPFLWADSYVNQIWLNNALQLAELELLVNTKSVPYNSAGYALISAAAADPIAQAATFGAIRTGITLSQAQKAEVNTAAGKQIDSVITQQGYYFQVLDATPQVRAARGTPPCNLWYTDGQSVQKLTLNSINIQ